MDAYLALDIIRDALFAILKISGPLLFIGLIVGVSISFLQALTQIQEMTLTFIPKIIIMILSMVLLLPFMFSSISTLTHKVFSKIVQ